MSGKIFFKALINGIITWLVVGLLLCLTNDASFVEALFTPVTLLAASGCVLGCCIGSKRKAET